MSDWLTEEMDRQARAGIPNLDNIGDGTMQYDGPRCAADDCRTPVDDDGDTCQDCRPTWVALTNPMTVPAAEYQRTDRVWL